MKTHRFTAALLAGLLLAAGPASSKVTVQIGGAAITFESTAKKRAKELSTQTAEVQQRFAESRRALHTVPASPKSEPAYLRREVTDLIARTGEDLDQAIVHVEPSVLAPLRAWTADQLQRIQGEIAAPPRAAALLQTFGTPRAVAVIASLNRLLLPAFVDARAGKAAPPPPPDTVPAGKADGLLDQLGEVVNRIFFLASHDDLEVKLWVGSTPAAHAKFRFWAEGRIRGVVPAPLIIQTNGKRDKVVRGLYDYSAALAKGRVTELVEFPSPAGAAAAQTSSERLDLVNGSPFFCCRFNEQYCHHVDSQQECQL
jgi:hypothetical protein